MDADVVVIGAGAAGLAAARRLARSGRRVVLLEARDRTGGRAFSRPIEGSPVRAELGAEFIHGPAPETMTLLRETVSAAIDIGGESWSRQGSELLRDDEDFLESAALFDRARLLAQDESVDSYLKRFETNETMRRAADAARGFVEGFEAADPSIASVVSIAQEWATGVDSTAARPLFGYEPIVARLQSDCAAAGVEIALRTVVRAIAWRPGFVRVEALRSDGTARTVEAAAALVTLPVGVLRHEGDETSITFEPELPQDKLTALHHIEMGHAVKVVLWFRAPFWETIEGGRYRDAAFFRSERGFPAFWTQLPLRSRLIVAWAGGPKAVALQGSSEAKLIERARDQFGEMLGAGAAARDECEGGAMHDWSADPFSRGAYSYVAAGGGEARAILGAPIEQTLFFAGEATSTDGQGGTVNGAIETGERAAAAIRYRAPVR
jgi:monoamine oxidase